VSPFIAALLVSVLVFGCDTGPTGEKRDGIVSFSIERTEAIPSASDSALVRVWLDDESRNLDFNAVRFVKIPDRLGQAREVTLEVPAGTGYEAGVLALETDDFDPNKRKIRASGYSASLDVRSGDTTDAETTVSLVEASLEYSGTIERGDTLQAKVRLAPPEIKTVSYIEGWLNDHEDFAVPAVDLLRAGEKSLTDSTIEQGLEVEQLIGSESDTTYVKIRLHPDIPGWLSSNPSLNDGSFRMQPVDLPVDNRRIKDGSSSFAVPCCAKQKN
jgi:hypothetical protein